MNKTKALEEARPAEEAIPGNLPEDFRSEGVGSSGKGGHSVSWGRGAEHTAAAQGPLACEHVCVCVCVCAQARLAVQDKVTGREKIEMSPSSWQRLF